MLVTPGPAFVIIPHETRPKLIAALEALLTKREPGPRRKHGNIPL